MFIAFVQTASGISMPTNVAGGYSVNHDSADKAKAALADYISRNKNSFQNGYTAYVIDDSTHKVVTFATVPQPTLEWQ